MCSGPEDGIRDSPVSPWALGVGRFGVPVCGLCQGRLCQEVPHSALCWGPLFPQLCGKGWGLSVGFLPVLSDPWERKEWELHNSLGWKNP